MAYSIKIITRLGETSLDMEEVSFPYTFEANDIAELKDRSASWSYTIKLPKSPHNMQVFEHAGSPYVNTNAPYKRYACNVYSDGVCIINRGVLFLDNVTRDYFEVQILSGVSDFFELLKDINFSESEDLYNVHAALTTLPSSVDGVSFPFLSFFAQPGHISSWSKSQNVYAYAIPCVSIDSVLGKIESATGYSIITKSGTRELLSNLLMVVPKKSNIANSAGQEIDRELATHAASTSYVSGMMRFSGARIASPCVLNPGHSLEHTKWVADIEITITSQLVSFFESQDDGRIEINGLLINKNNYRSYVTNGKINVSLELENEPSVSIETSPASWFDGFQTRIGLQYGLCYVTFRCVQSEDTEQPIPGAIYPITPNLGFNTAQDFFKAVCQLMAWTIVVDSNEKKVYAYDFQHIISNKLVAPNWSQKVDMDSDTTTSFVFGSYARKNNILLAQNKSSEFQDSASFYVQSDSIEPEKDIVTIPFTSGHGGIVELYEIQEDGTYKWKGADTPHLLDISSGIKHYVASNVLGNYSGLISVVNRPEVIELGMVLSSIDIANLDNFTPIFLTQYGAYFYVNKISNWEDGKTCKVELVRL